MPDLKCSKQISDPDLMTRELLPNITENFFVCSCEDWHCAWGKNRLGKVRRRIADVVFKIAWKEVLQLALKLKVNTD